MFDLVPQHLPSAVYLPQGDKTPSTSGNLYLRQPYTHAVIELVEVSPPPPRRFFSVIGSEEASSSSSASSAFDEHDMEEDEEDDDMEYEDEEGCDDEAACSSYCSSDFPVEESTPATPVPSDSLKGRMKRVLLWRERAQLNFSGSSPSLKRKLQEIDTPIPQSIELLHRDGPTSKRSRSSSSSSASSSRSASSASASTSSHHLPASLSPFAHRRYSNTSSITSAELEMHPCPACDAFFPTLQSLRAHGKATGNEACCVAVEYAFEQ